MEETQSAVSDLGCRNRSRTALVLLLCAAAPATLTAQRQDVILATTTSTRDTGLLDSLLPRFERQTGYRVKVVAVGSGQALEMGRRGDADLVLSHAPEAERTLMDSGFFIRRRLVMHNQFVIVGPADDPAGILGMHDAVAAFAHIASHQARFVSRGDRSGTHMRELSLWRKANVPPPPPGGWYIEGGQGMGATLQLASEKRAYTLTDEATYLTWRDKISLISMVRGDSLLYNVYHVLELNRQNAARINVRGARALADFFVAAETQARIAEFGKTRYGQSLFVPDAGKPDRW